MQSTVPHIHRSGKPSPDRSWKGWISPFGEFFHCNGRFHRDLVKDFAREDARIKIDGLDPTDPDGDTKIRLEAVSVGYVRVVARQGDGLTFEGLPEAFQRKGVKETVMTLIENSISDIGMVRISRVSYPEGILIQDTYMRFDPWDDKATRLSKATDGGLLERKENRSERFFESIDEKKI